MARARIIKPEFFDDPKVGRLSIQARFLYIGLWVQADDAGNVQTDPAFLRSRLFPHDSDVTVDDVEGWLRECSGSGRVALYESSGERYGHIIRFAKHQVINKPSKWRNPEPSEPVDGSSVVVLPEHYGMKSKSKSKPKPKPKPKPFTPRTTEIDDEFVTRMADRFGSVLGGRAGILERIEEAKGHKAWIGWTDKQAGVRGWLRRDAERVPGRNGVSNRAPTVRTSEDAEFDKAVAEGFRSGRIKDGEPVKLGDIVKRMQGGGA